MVRFNAFARTASVSVALSHLITPIVLKVLAFIVSIDDHGKVTLLWNDGRRETHDIQDMHLLEVVDGNG